MKLTDAKLRTLTEPGKHFDGGGLYLELTAAGGRYWRWKYRYGGKEKRLALGVYPEIGLKGAREAMAKARELLQAGQDPGEVRKADKAQAAHESANTLKAVALDWLTHQSDRWDAGTKARIKGTLEADIFPTLGHRPMASIKPGEIMAAVRKIEKRVMIRYSNIRNYLIIPLIISANPPKPTRLWRLSDTKIFLS